MRAGDGSCDAEEIADLGFQLLAVPSAHDLRVDAERDGRVRVADLRLAVWKVVSGGDHVGDVGSTEGVWGHVRTDWGPHFVAQACGQTPPAFTSKLAASSSARRLLGTASS